MTGIDVRGHTAATLYQAAVAAAGPGRYAMDPGMRAAWRGCLLYTSDAADEL